MLRIVMCILVYVGMMALFIHFGIGSAAGDGVSMLGLGATASAFLGFVAFVWRTRLWLRSIFVVAACCVSALLVDQLSYYAWHARLDRFVTGLQHDVQAGSPDIAQEMKLRPTYLRIEPGQVFLFTFEPPALAWTYHLGATSESGRALMAGWHRLLRRASDGVGVDPVAETIIEPHEAYAVTVASSDGVMACRAGGEQGWLVSVEAEPGGQSL